jgi:isoleucyl-tRNA synthetase
MITNSSPWDNLKFDEAGVQEVSRTFFGKLFQTYSFLTMYANVDGWCYSEEDVPMSQRPEIDRWILSELNTLVKNVDACYNDYEPTKAGRLIQDFVIDNVSNWFVRLSRKRFWGSAMSVDKLSAYQTLYTCLETVAKLMAPIAPYYADRLYTDLTAATDRADAQSVHLATFPISNESMIDASLEYRMKLAQQITSMVLSLRKKEKIIVRQPLQSISIPVGDAERQNGIEAVKQLILDEVNVKELNFVEGNGMLVKKVKCNFRTMGKKFGKLMKSVASAVETLSQEQIASLESNEWLDVTIENGEMVRIESVDVEIFSEDIPGWTVANEGSLTVALDITVTDALRTEGVARELVKRIQNIRKESNFEITDRIVVELTHSEQTDKAVVDFADYISTQVLANEIKTVDHIEDGVEIDFDDYKIYLKVQKV